MNAHRRKLVVTLAVAVLALVGVVSASAAGKNRTLFRYTGQLAATPASGATSLSVTVQTGNKRALRSMLGHAQTQSFAIGDRTEFLVWTAGVPHVATLAELHANDWVTVNVRAAAKSTLDEIEGTQAGIVGDRGPDRVANPLPEFVFIGKLAEPAAGGKVTVTVGAGNRPALRKLIGHSSEQTFAYGDGTIFLHWAGKVPTVTTPDQLHVGDRIVVRVRAARTSTLDQIEATAAARVAEHEPPAKS